jgi:hypothetical protein
MTTERTFAGIKCGPASLRGQVDSAQYVAFDKGFYGEGHKYQPGPKNFQAYELGQQERDVVEAYADEVVKEMS